MKTRKNIMVDEELLERARKVLGEATNSGAIDKALQKAVRQESFWKAYRKFEKLAHTEGAFDPDYIQEKLAKSVGGRNTRVSAHETRAPRQSRTRRGTR